MQVTKRILFFGATGTIGKPILKALVDNIKLFEHLAIFTSARTAESKKQLLEDYTSRGLVIVVGDIQNEREVLDAYEGIDTVISTLGRGAIDSQILLIRLAESAPSVHRFIPSEFGTDIEHNATSVSEIPSQGKLKVRAYLQSTTSLHYTYLVTGPYADAEPPAYLSALVEHPELGSFNTKTKTAVLLGNGNDRISLTTVADVGKHLLRVLMHPELCTKPALKVQSFVTTPIEILKEFERQTKSKWTVSYTSREDLRGLEKQAWEEKKAMAPIYTLRRIWTEGGTLYDHWDNETLRTANLDTLSEAVELAIEQQSRNTQTVDGNKTFA